MMINFWGNESLADKINTELKKNTVPHSQLITDIYGNGGLFLAFTIAKELLGRDPFKHPDFFLCFPIIKIDRKTEVSNDLMELFKIFYDKNNYCTTGDWLQSFGSVNKQGSIGVEEINQLHQKINLKAFEGKNKVCVIWAPELLNISAANKILKLLEEPPHNTFFLLVSERPEQILPTIFSRTVVLNINQIPELEIERKLNLLEVSMASSISKASSGSWSSALEHTSNSGKRKKLELLWIKGFRGAFKSTGNKSIVIDLMDWAEEAASLTRDEQKTFFELGSVIIRSAFISNYVATDVVNYFSLNDFKIEKLSPFINSKNIFEIKQIMDNSHYQILRNANSKILYSNLILKIAKLLNIKED